MRGRILRVTALIGMFALLIPAITSAQAPVRYVDLLFPTEDVVVTTHVYGQAINSRGEPEVLDLDLYQAANDTATGRGLYVWAHGGNFNSGNKSGSGPLRDYARRGWVGMSIHYRLDPDLVGGAAIGILQNPDQIPRAQAAAKNAQHDMQAAVRWARANADELRIDPNKIGVGGISAGGITALATAFNSADPGNSGTPNESSEVQAAISHAGAYAPGLQGGAPMPGAPPIGVYHGTNDEQVPYPLAPIACVLTIAMLNTCEFVTFVAETHRTLGTDLARDFLYRHVILAGTRTNTPVIADLDGSPVKAIASVEPANTDPGVTAGVVSSTDPAVLSEGFLQLARYALDALGIDAPF